MEFTSGWECDSVIPFLLDLAVHSEILREALIIQPPFRQRSVVMMRGIGSVTIQRAKAEDAAILTSTCKSAFDSDSEVGSPGPGGPPGYDSLEWNADKIRNRYLQYYKILIGNDIVGGFIVGDRGPGYQVCERIWIDPDYMRRGIGKKAFELIWEKYPSADLWTLGT
ncbi:MAG: N-acetyltransferase, partial [Candidatus Thorarchaeota archaeon]|nr:N-acetyltransferase [Candidatus Thorarchaeota archaeon]